MKKKIRRTHRQYQRRRQSRVRRIHAAIERLEDRRLLACAANGSFGPPTFVHDVNLALANESSLDCTINADASGMAVLSGEIFGPRGLTNKALFHDDDNTILIKVNDSVAHSFTITSSTQVGNRLKTTFNKTVAIPSNTTSNIDIEVRRTGFPSSRPIDNFKVADDSTKPTASINSAIDDPRNSSVQTVEIQFSERINNSSFTRDDLQLTLDNGADRISDAVSVALKSGTTTVFTVSGLGGLTSEDGRYELTVDATGVSDLAGNTGTGSDSAEWTLDTSPPTIDDPPALDPEDDTGRFDTDAVTRQNDDLTFTGRAAEATSVSVQISNASFSETVTATLTAGGIYTADFGFDDKPGMVIPQGEYAVVATATDTAGNEIVSDPLTLIIDRTPPARLSRPDLDSASDTAGPHTPNDDEITSELAPTFQVTGAEIDAAVTLLRNGAKVEPVVPDEGIPTPGQRVTTIQDLALDPAQADGTYRYQVFQTDIAGNPGPTSDALEVVIDSQAPEFQDLDGTTDGEQHLRLSENDRRFPTSRLPVPVTDNTRPRLVFVIQDQQFRTKDNVVRLELLARADDGTELPQSRATTFITVEESSATGPGSHVETGPIESVFQPANELAPGMHQLFVRATDGAGKSAASNNFTLFVSAVGEATIGAPGTPVFSESLFIGATVPSQAALDQIPLAPNQIVVDQAIPEGFSVNVDEAPEFRVLKSTPASIGGLTVLDLDGELQLQAGDKVSWLRPWQMSFDKTTQTVWFTMEDGSGLGHFDPATGSVDMYDVSIGNSASDPHGVFFDFDTHLTPRVWFVYRNQDAIDGADGDEVLRLSYFDVAEEKLFTFDFEDIAGEFDLEDHDSHGGGGDGSGSGGGSGGGGASGSTSGGGSGGGAGVSSSSDDGPVPLKIGHAVFVDATGGVWLSAEGSGTLVELDFDQPPGGNRGPATLDNQSAKVIAHTVPKSFGADPSMAADFQNHGLQTVVDQRDGTRYVWAVNGNERIVGESTQRIALLVPGETDRWFEFAIPKTIETASHLLFTAFDDNETPGIPEDDKLIFTDPGFRFPQAGDGIIASMDVGAIVERLQRGQSITDMTPEVHVVHVPKLPGANANANQSAPIQSFVERAGTVFFADPQGGFGRVPMSEFSAVSGSATTVTATVKARAQQPDHTRITMDEVATQPTRLDAQFDASAGGTWSHRLDRSQMTGADQYEVAAEALRRGEGQGPFRAALNAANTIYGSLSQSDHLSNTMFAESARRQMAAVTSPFDAPDGAITQARMAFQALRNGSVVLTARGDGRIADEQINLLAEMVDQGRISGNPGRFLIAGEATAVTADDGRVHVMGRSRINGVVQYTFTPSGEDWEHGDLVEMRNWSVQRREMPGVVLAEDTVPAGPLGFSVTTADGHWLTIPINGGDPIDRTAATGTPDAAKVYSAVSVTRLDGVIYAYGTNQTGNLIEYRIESGSTSLRPIQAESRETRMLRNVRALTTADGIRHIFATDGVSRLVHYEIDAAGNVRLQENISQQTADNGQNFGYFPFQQPFTGRVYTYVAPLIEDDGTIRVYGTNGGDLIEFTRPAGGRWRVANLTNDTNATFGGQAPNVRVPANAVFGGPTAYIDDNGGRHILQINAEGEVVEYFTYGDGLFPTDPVAADRFNTQNVNLLTGKQVETDLGSNLFQDATELTAASAGNPDPSSDPQEGSGSSIPSASSTPREDVSGDGSVSALDALLVVNQLNRWNGAAVADPELAGPQTTSLSGDRFDVNDDGKTTALDALLVINYLSRQDRLGDAEAEWVPMRPWAADDEDDEKETRWDEALLELTTGPK